MGGVGKQGRELGTTPRIPPSCQSAQCIPVIALAAGNDAVALGLPYFQKVLPRELDRCLDRFGAPRDKIYPIYARRRVLDQAIGQTLCRIGREKAGVREGKLVNLGVQGGADCLI